MRSRRRIIPIPDVVVVVVFVLPPVARLLVIRRLVLAFLVVLVVVVLKVDRCTSFQQQEFHKKGNTLPRIGIQLSSSSSSSSHRRRGEDEREQEQEPRTSSKNSSERNRFQQKFATLGGILGSTTTSTSSPSSSSKSKERHNHQKFIIGSSEPGNSRKISSSSTNHIKEKRSVGPHHHHRNRRSFHNNNGQQQQQHRRRQERNYSGQPHDRFPPASEFNQWLQHRINKSTGPNKNNPSNVQMAEEALWERITRSSSASSSLEPSASGRKKKVLKYTTISFNIVLNGWAKQRSIHGARRADQLLHQLLELQVQQESQQQQQQQQQQNPKQKPKNFFVPKLQADTYSYSAVLNAYAKSGGGKAAALRAEELLTQMQNTLFPSSSSSFSSLSSSSSNSDKTSQEELKSNNNSNKETATTTTTTTDVCHNAVMDAWAASGDPQAGERAESILRKISEPSRISYNACIKAYARSQAPIEAQRLLEEMTLLSTTASMSKSNSTSLQQQQQQYRPELEPDKISISTCIDAWSKWSKNFTHGALNADSLLQKMEHDYEEWNRTQQQQQQQCNEATTNTQTRNNNSNSNNNKQPDVKAYTAALTAYARAGWPEASQKALELIHRMERYSDQRPNAPFFNTIIHMLAKSKSKTVPSTTESSETTPEQMAEGILQHMKHQFAMTQDEDIRPTVITYTAVIAVIAAHCSSSSNGGGGGGGQVAAAQNAEKLLDELETLYNTTKLEVYLPNTKTFGAVLSVWAKAAASTTMSDEEEATISGDSLWQRAETLLERMEGLYNRTGCEELKPTSILYSQVFRILANGRDPHAATRGLELMKRLKAYAKSSSKYGDQIRLDSTMYAYLIVTFTKSRVDNVVEVATRILQEVEEGYLNGMGDLKPTSLLYSAVLQAYAKSSSEEGAKLAEELLEKTKALYKLGKMYAKPTTLFYNAVIDAHARSNGGLASAERAEALLDEMEVRGRVGDSELCLTTRSYNAAILAWKNSNCTDAPERAEALLKKMSAKYKAGDERCRPDRVTINSIIGVWAKSPKEGAAVRAEEFLRFMEKFSESGDPIKPDRYSYNSVIDAYSRSPDPGAARRAQALFDRMKALHEGGEREIKPDLITLTSLRKAWVGSNDDEAKFYQRKVGEMILKEVDRQRKAKRRHEEV